MAPKGAARSCSVCEFSFVKGAHRRFCTGSCGSWVHRKCWSSSGSVDLTDSADMQAQNEDWRCDDCSPPPEVEQGVATLELTAGESYILTLLHESKEERVKLMSEVAELNRKQDKILSLLQQNQQKPDHQNTMLSVNVASLSPATKTNGKIIKEKLPPPQQVGGSTNGNAAPTPARSFAATAAASPAARPVVATAQAPPAPRVVAAELTNQRKHNQEKKQTSDIFVKNSPQQRKENKTKLAEEVKNTLTAPIIKEHIEDVVVLEHPGTVVVKCSNKVSRQKVVELLTAAIGEKYSIKAAHSQPVKYSVLVRNVQDADLPIKDGSVDKDAIVNSIKDKNDLPPDCSIEVAVVRKSKGQQRPQLIIRVDEVTKNNLSKTGVKFGYSRLKVNDLGPFPSCGRCCAHFHSTAQCMKQEVNCFVCAGNHLGKECPNTLDTGTHKCINCSNYNKRIEMINDPNFDRIDENHKAGDRTMCPSYQTALKTFLAKHEQD
jgi:protein required for attachment to host cells